MNQQASSMPSLRIYDSRSKKEKLFKPQGDVVSLYVCGPTVYDRAHIGNARSAVIFDLLYRLLKALYPKVCYVRNITDIDDKVIAASRQRNISTGELTTEVTGWFYEDMDALGVLRPDIEPKATTHVPEMIQMIELLLQKGSAYEMQGQVMFHVKHFSGYGALSGRNLDNQKAGARIKVDQKKKHPGDFVLWKPSSDDEPGWESPWGRGRPGWHIECSAMSYKYLGIPFDIHGGGHDLLFPHHENERAQSCACFEKTELAHFWMHNGLLRVDGEKMSKSIGNILKVNQLREKHSGDVLRWCLLSTHYRKDLDWNDQLLKNGQYNIMLFAKALEGVGVESCKTACHTDFLACLLKDLNTHQALLWARNVAENVSRETSSEKKQYAQDMLQRALRLLGFSNELLAGRVDSNKKRRAIDSVWVESKIQERQQARMQKDYVKADAIRQELLAYGVLLEDGERKTDWFCE